MIATTDTADTTEQDNLPLKRTPAGPAPLANPAIYAGALAVAAMVGSLSLLPVWLSVARVWASDPLRFIGAIFPWLSLLGVMATWQRIGWRLEGSRWGLAAVAAAALIGRFVGVPILYDFFRQQHGWWLLHNQPVVFLFAAGSAYLFGGRRLVRAAIAPLCLLLFLNPVPRAFNTALDLPLQELSANAARSFAHLIGLWPTGEQLRMMFTPQFGMMIVPGCNGIRGAITLAYLALIFGYTQRLKPWLLGGLSVGALFLGYGMNLARLCLLVVYYRAGIDWVAIRPYGTEVDYVIGCSVFLFGTLGLGYAIRSLAPGPETAPAAETPQPVSPARRRQIAVSAAIYLAFTGVFIVNQWHLLATAFPLTIGEKQALAALPQAVGDYRLVRNYDEHLPNGTLSLVMGDYAAPATAASPARTMTLGLWVENGVHLVADSKKLQGIVPVSTGAFEAAMRSGQPIYFGTGFYDEGATLEYDAEATCIETGCYNPLLRYQPPPADIAFSPLGRSLPLLLRRTWTKDGAPPTPELRTQFEADVRQFAAQMDLPGLVRLAGFPE